MTDDYAGQVIENVIELRARSFESLPGIFACCLDNPSVGNDEFEAILLAIHAQQMFRRNRLVIDRLLSTDGPQLTGDDVDALTWMKAACECLASSIESLRNSDQLWVPDPVRRALVPFEGEIPF